MYSLVCLLWADEDARSGLIDKLKALGGAAAPVLEGNFNGGDIAARFSFGEDAEYRSARAAIDGLLHGSGVTKSNWAFFEDGSGAATAPGMADGIWRGLLLCADRPQAAALLPQFEAEMKLMAKYIPAIRNWRFSNVIEAGGDLNWTHVWEQEYADIGGLMGPYMLHPFHWALIDRWFDPECPDWIVNIHLCHSFAALGAPVLG